MALHLTLNTVTLGWSWKLNKSIIFICQHRLLWLFNGQSHIYYRAHAHIMHSPQVSWELKQEKGKCYRLASSCLTWLWEQKQIDRLTICFSTRYWMHTHKKVRTHALLVKALFNFLKYQLFNFLMLIQYLKVSTLRYLRLNLTTKGHIYYINSRLCTLKMWQNSVQQRHGLIWKSSSWQRHDIKIAAALWFLWCHLDVQ